jgi:hypothetical protein
MAAPMTAAQFAAVLRAEGVTVVEVGDWETHNRNSKGAWGPVNGVMIHHTVTSGSARTVAICRDGYTALPGPLCHGVITKDGRVHLVGYGRTNHAGSGDPDVLAAVIAERALPADNEATTDGNRHFYGFECENLGDGKDPWPAAQLLAIEKVSAAICRHHGWSEKSVIGHLEWQPGKVDPRGFTMASMRGRIAARLDGNQSQEEGDMPTVPEIVKGLAKTDGVFDVPARWRQANPTNEQWQFESILAFLGDRTLDVGEAVTALAAKVAAGPVELSEAQVAALADKVAAHPALAEQIAERVAVKLATRLAE